MHRKWNNMLNKDSQNKIYTIYIYIDRSNKEFEFKVKTSSIQK